MPAKNSKRSSANPFGWLPRLIILAGIGLLVTAVFLFKNQPARNVAPANESPAAQLDRYRQAGKPVFAFFHSTTCQSCLDMMETVDQVYPDFKAGVALVDVNVYDPQNESLLQRAGITSIPTLMFVNRSGQSQVSVGVMEAGVLRQQLAALQETP